MLDETKHADGSDPEDEEPCEFDSVLAADYLTGELDADQMRAVCERLASDDVFHEQMRFMFFLMATRRRGASAAVVARYERIPAPPGFPNFNARAHAADLVSGRQLSW